MFVKRVLMALACGLLAFGVVGCSSGTGTQAETGSTLAPPRPPIHMSQSTPQAAVFSYLEGLNYAYRLADSEIASQTMTPYEWVRVDSYIEFNRQQGRGIDQTITAFDVRGMTGKEPTVTVSTYEEWLYRYFDLETEKYTSADLTATYDAKYTVVKSGGTWLVDKVDVTPVGTVK